MSIPISSETNKHSVPEQPVQANVPLLEPQKVLPNPIDMETSSSPQSLDRTVTTTPENPEELRRSQLKTMSSTALILNQSLNGVYHLIDRGISTTMTGLFRGTESVLFISRMMQKDYEANLAKLKAMTGDENLGGFLSEYADHVATEMIPGNFDQGSYLNQTLEGEAGFLKQLVGSMLLKVAVNMGKRLKQEGKEVSLASITTSVTALMVEMTQSSREAFTEALEIENPKARKLAIRNATLPIVDALLHLAFPKGAAELPVRWGAHYLVWKQLREKIVERMIPFQHLVQTISDTKVDNAQQLFLMKKIEEIGAIAEKEGGRFLSDPTNAGYFAHKVLKDMTKIEGVNEEKLKWLTKQIQQFGDQKNPIGEMLWKFLGVGGTATLSYMMNSMMQNDQGEEKDIFSAMFRLLDKMSVFDGQNREKIHLLHLKLTKEGKIPEKCQEYTDCFKPLANELQDSFGVSILKKWMNEIGGESAVYTGEEVFLQKLVRVYQTDVLPAIQLYRAIDGSPKEVEALITPITDSFIVAKKQLYQQLITPRAGVLICSEQEANVVSEQIGNLCGVIAQHAAPIIQKSIQEQMRALGKMPERLRSTKAMEVQCLYLKAVIQSALTQVLVNYLQEVNETPLSFSEVHNLSSSRASLSQLLKKAAQALEKHLMDDAGKIEAAALIADPEAKKKALQEAFQPLAKTLTQLAVPFSDKTKGFPLNVPFQEALQFSWSTIQESVIPDMLTSMYMDTSFLKRAEATSRDVIAEKIKTPYVPEACRVLAGWIHDFAPTYVCANRADLSEGIYQGVSKYLAQLKSPEGMSVSEYIKKNEEMIKKRLCEDILSVIPPDGPLVNATRPLTTQYMESFMLKLCSNMASNIEEAQGKTPEEQEIFMVNLGLRVLNAFNQHFSKINEITSTLDRSAAYSVKHEEFIAEFGDKLHPGIPQTKEGLQARDEIRKELEFIDKERLTIRRTSDPVKQLQSRKKIKIAQAKIRKAKENQAKERRKFFEPLAKSLTELSGFKGPEDLPLPENMRKTTWETFTTSLLPSALESMFEIMMQPETRAKMMINGLETLNRALDSAQPATEQPAIVEDQLQPKLNKACGELVLQLVQQVPHSMLQLVFAIDKFKILEKQSAEMVGKAVRSYLGTDLNLFTLMDQGVQSTLATLYPGGEWRPNSRGVLRFEPDKSKIKPMDLSQFTDEALEQQERERVRQSDEAMKQMRKMMVKTARRVMSDSVMTGLNFPFFKVKQAWESLMAKCTLPEEAVQFLRRVGDLMLFRLIEVFLSFCLRQIKKAGPMVKETLSFVSSPFRETFWFFMEMHLGRKADDVIQNLQLEIHENLLYQMTDVMVKAMTGQEPSAEPDAKLIEPLVVAAERRGWLENAQLIKRLGLYMAQS